MFEKYLQQIGLSEKEAEVYVALLQYENASVSELAKQTKVNRTTIYPVLETLAKKGLVSEVQVDKKTNYQAEPPERLETFVERQKIVLDENAKRLNDIIPQLKSIQRESGERPVVKYFEGREGIISSSEELYSSDEETGIAYLVYPKDLLLGLFKKEETDKYKKVRLGKKVKSKVLYTYKDGIIPSSEDGDRIKIDENKYPIKCDISVIGNLVRINTLNEKLSAIVIRSKDFADTMRSILKLSFDNLESQKK